jgi:hypothetical protein
VQNLIRLTEIQTAIIKLDKSAWDNLRFSHTFISYEAFSVRYIQEFPKPIVKENLNQSNPYNNLRFVEGLCHRCNLGTPSVKFCLDMYGGKFVQTYGWYITQTYLRLGILRSRGIFLDDVCPEEFKNDYIESVRVKHEYDIYRLDFNEKYQSEYASYDHVYWHERHNELRRLNRTSRQASRNFTRKIENITRQEFGISKVGEGWVSETILAQMVSRLLNRYQVIRHYRPEWLDGLELDIYVPELKLAFEYQGQQHFFPIAAWGGEDAFRGLQERDNRKKKLCAELGITLIIIEFKDPLTIDFINEKLEQCNNEKR